VNYTDIKITFPFSSLNTYNIKKMFEV